MKRILLDSDVIIDILRGFKGTIEAVGDLYEGNELWISGISEAEIFAGKDMGDEERRGAISRFLSKFEKVELTNEILKLAGDFKRKYGLTLLDCIIAATAYAAGAELFTKNLRDFGKVEEIAIHRPKGSKA
jgi:predicted nucleic acid-binding protein